MDTYKYNKYKHKYAQYKNQIGWAPTPTELIQSRFIDRISQNYNLEKKLYSFEHTENQLVKLVDNYCQKWHLII